MFRKNNTQKRFFIARNHASILVAFLFVSLLSLFWLNVQYPSPENMTVPEDSRHISQLLTSKHILEYGVPVSSIQEIFQHFINWMASIFGGVVFSILFASCFILFFRYLKFSFREDRPFYSVAQGSTMGAPLGLCVNCTTAIAEGIIAAGQKKELALAMLFSSPLLNIVVILKGFMILPIQMSILRLVDTLVLIALIPFILKISNVDRYSNTQPSVKKKDMWGNFLPEIRAHKAQGFQNIIKAFIIDLTYHCLKLTKQVTPLLIFAGLFTAIVSTSMDWSNFLMIGETNIDQQSIILLIIAVALIASILPITMGLDIMIAYGLLQLSVSPVLVSSALFPFAGYSIVTFLSLWRMFNLKLALNFLLTISLIGATNGWIYLYVWG